VGRPAQGRGKAERSAHHLARTIGQAFRAAKERGHVITQFTVQSDHLHLIVEAADREALMRVARGMIIAFAKRINHALRRRGPVFTDRYHTRTAESPASVRATLVYVLMNHKKHCASSDDIDVFSSARWFDGWSTPVPPPTTPSPVSPSRTELGAMAWRGLGLISPREGPRSKYEETVIARNSCLRFLQHFKSHALRT
jgi:REP element-mobilizing transposase RayT